MKITYKYKEHGSIQTLVWIEEIIWKNGEYINADGKTLFALSVEYAQKIPSVRGVSLVIENKGHATVKFAKRLIPFLSSNRLFEMFKFVHNV